jgi:hypothetical protein
VPARRPWISFPPATCHAIRLAREIESEVGVETEEGTEIETAGGTKEIEADAVTGTEIEIVIETGEVIGTGTGAGAPEAGIEGREDVAIVGATMAAQAHQAHRPSWT